MDAEKIIEQMASGRVGSPPRAREEGDLVMEGKVGTWRCTTSVISHWQAGIEYGLFTDVLLN